MLDCTQRRQSVCLSAKNSKATQARDELEAAHASRAGDACSGFAPAHDSEPAFLLCQAGVAHLSYRINVAKCKWVA